MGALQAAHDEDDEHGTAPLGEVDPEGYLLLIDVCQLLLTQLAEPSLPIDQLNRLPGDTLQVRPYLALVTSFSSTHQYSNSRTSLC